MNAFLLAHGHDPGPTQRPMLAGAVCGLFATLPALIVLSGFGSLDAESRILGISVPTTIAAGALAMIVAGALYGRIFRRAANDRRGGWLFGMAYGFLLWSAGAVMILPALGGGAAPGGEAAIGIFLAFLAWGTALGSLFPSLHRRMHVRAERLGDPMDAAAGPNAAAPRAQPRTRETQRR